MILSLVENDTAGYFVEASVLSQYKFGFLVANITSSRKVKTGLRTLWLRVMISTVPSWRWVVKKNGTYHLNISGISSLIVHRMPLYFIPVSVSLRVARTLLKILLSKNLNFNTQFTHAFRQPGALNLLQKIKIFLKLTVVMWPHIVEKVAVFGLRLLWKKYS